MQLFPRRCVLSVDGTCLCKQEYVSMKNIARSIHSFFLLAIFIIVLHSLVCAQQNVWIDSAEAAYNDAAKQYDSELLLKIAGSIARKPLAEQQSSRAALLEGLIYWRMELIAYCSGNRGNVDIYGSKALKKLDEAEKAGSDAYLTASHKALVSQLLSGLGIRKGAFYGPRSATELKKAQKANPQGYFSLLVDAINMLKAPSFFGGNPKKAVAMLEKMAGTFPDSIDVKIHLADAYGTLGKRDDARMILAPIVTTYPLNLLARKVAATLKAK